ncbi:MAG: peptide ABC transporter substrate-binding protein [Verrucomicrobiae bacterium]|nr:peptide ABC transporter substrate-binding protein [Verrucomicrobiae bacterium]
MLRVWNISGLWWLLPLALALAGCDSGVRRADLVVLNGTEPESLDPAIITGQPEMRLVSSLFEGLTALDSEARVIPGMAERWEISPDGRRYVFHLRRGARWSNGDAVTAMDFVRSWQRTLAPSTAAPYAYQLYCLENAQAYNEGKLRDFGQVGVGAPDDLTLEVRLRNPTPFFLDLCAFVTLMPVHLASIERCGEDWVKPGRLVCNGPFMLEEWKINHRVRLRANPFYWARDRVRLGTVDMLPTSQAATAFNLYSVGAADVILDKGLIPTILLADLRGRPDFHASSFLATYFYRVNVTRRHLANPRVRRALGMAIDKRRLVERITRAGELPAGSFVPPGIPGYEPPSGLPFDPGEARRLLAEAGYPDGKGYPPLVLLFNKSELNEQMATEIQDMLRRGLGVRVELKQQEWKVYLNTMDKLDYDLCRSSWVGDYMDPNTFLDLFVTGGGNNRTGWSDPEYDRLIQDASREAARDKRRALLLRAEKLLCEEQLPIIPLYHNVGIQFYDAARVGGIKPNLLDMHPLQFIHRLDRP